MRWAGAWETSVGRPLLPVGLHRGCDGDQQDFGTCYWRCCDNKEEGQRARWAPRPNAASRARGPLPSPARRCGSDPPTTQQRSLLAAGRPSEAAGDNTGSQWAAPGLGAGLESPSSGRVKGARS